MIKTMTGTLRYQFAIITAYHVACVLALASEVPHELVRRQADEEASQVVFSNSNPEQNSLNGAPSSDPQKVEVKPSDWRFLKLLQVNSSAPHNVIEAENNPDEWHALASTLLHQSFVADQIMQYQLARLLGDGEPDTNSSYVPYYLDQSARLVAGLNDSAPDDLFQSLGMMVVGCPCLTSSNKGHVSALLVALSDVPAPIVQIDQKVTDKDDDTSGFPCESEDPNDLPPNTQNVEVDYLGGVYDNTDELSSFNSSSMSYLMFLLTGRIDKRSLAVRVDQDMTVVRNCTDDCDITTTEMPTTTPTEPIDPIPEEEVDTIVQVIEDVDCFDCNDTMSEYSQSVIIENKYEMDDFEKALSRLQESENSHCVIEAIYSQDANATANATWYYMDQQELVWTEVEEEYESDIHIGHGLVVILPLILSNGSWSYVILVRTYVDKPASPIVQIQQAFVDHSGCGCVGENATEDGTNVANYVSQHFEHRSNYSDLALDLDSMTDYIKMLEAVPPFERQYIDIIAINEIEGPDCNETTTMEPTTTVETTTPEETTTTVETTTTGETTTHSSTPTEVATESATGSTPMPATVTTVEITTGSTDSGPTPPAVTEMTATPGPTVTSEPSGSTGGAGPGGQGPGAGATPDGESSGSTGATGPGGQGPGAGNTPDGDQNGPSGTAPPGAQGPGASNSTGGEPSGSTGATGSGGQGPGVGATPDGGPSGSPVTAAPEGQGPGGANSTGGGPSGSPETAGPEGQGPGGANSTGGVTGVPVTQGPGGENTEKPEIEVPIGQYNTSNSGQFIATYFTIGTGNDTAIPIRFGQNIIDQLIRENSTVFRFNLQVRTSGAVTKAFDTLTQLASLTNIRQENEIDNEEENEVGTSDSTFVSALDRVNKTSTINNTNCINTIKLVLRKVQFTDARTGKLYPCDLSQPPYVEIVDTYNNSISQRFCYLNEDVTIHSFGDQMFGYVVTNGDPNIIPDIRAIQEKEKYCCGGVFYGDFRKPLIITSPNYPSSYNADMRCPYVFRCNVDYPECVIRLDFESFALSPNAMGRSRRQAESGNGTAATTQAPYVPPTGSDFNRTICAGEDVVRVSQCDSISTVNAREFCADNPPSQVYTGYKEVLLYFNSNDDRQNQGFVVKFTPKDKRKWIYSNAELEPECTCANNLPNQIRKFFRQRNKNKKNKNKNTTLRRVKRDEKKNMKEKRKAEKKERIPGRKTEKGRNEKKNAKGQAKEKKKGKKNRKMKEKQGKKKNRKMKKGKKSKKEEKKAEKAKRKGKLSNKKEKRLGNKKKNGKEVEDRAMNGRTNRKRQQYPWLVSVTQYERPLLEEKSSSDRPIERICGGTLLSDSYVLTTTSCCTYCATILAEENNKSSRKKRDAERKSNKQKSRRERKKNKEGLKNKKAEVEKRKGDRNTEKKRGNKRNGRKNKSKKNRNKDEAKEQKDKNSKKDQRRKNKRKNKGSKKNSDVKKKEKKEMKKKEKKMKKKEKKNMKKAMKDAPRKKKDKRRDPLKKDVGAIIGEGGINIKKLGDVKPQKIAGIFIPSDCYDKMGKTEIKGQPLYPVECPVLLKLEKKVKFNRFVKPMCLPIFDKIKINKERAGSIGYGVRKMNKIGPSKLPAEVINMRVLKKCEKRLKMKLDKTMICTKGKKKSGHMCFYDEGAPLLNVKVTGKGYKQHANLYAALAVPGCKLEKKKKDKSRKKRDATDLALPSARRKKGDKYNPMKSNKYYIDVWINIRSYKKWILNLVFEGEKSKACQRPKHFKSVPDIALKYEIEDPCPY